MKSLIPVCKEQINCSKLAKHFLIINYYLLKQFGALCAFILHLLCAITTPIF